MIQKSTPFLTGGINLGEYLILSDNSTQFSHFPQVLPLRFPPPTHVMSKEGKTGRKEGKIPMYQLREWQGASSPPTLTGTRQLQENTVCQLKGTASPFSQLPSAARTGWRCTLLNPAGTEKKKRIHHHISLLVSSSSILQSSSRHDLASEPAPEALSQTRSYSICGTGCLWQSWNAGSQGYNVFCWSTCWEPQLPLLPFILSICSFYKPKLGTPSLQCSLAASSGADEEDHIGPWKILIQDVSKWLCLSQWTEAVCSFKAVLQNRLQVDGLIKLF